MNDLFQDLSISRITKGKSLNNLKWFILPVLLKYKKKTALEKSNCDNVKEI